MRNANGLNIISDSCAISMAGSAASDLAVSFCIRSRLTGLDGDTTCVSDFDVERVKARRMMRFLGLARIILYVLAMRGHGMPNTS